VSKPLTPKQQRFCEEYIVDLNATQAAIRAGYSKKTAGSQGHDLLKKPAIQELVGKMRADQSEATGITAKSVLERLNAVANRCMDAEPVYSKFGQPLVVVTEDGDVAPVWSFQASGANRALELLGKNLGLFGDKVTHDGTVTVKVEHAGGGSLAE
jgi:phage terminase small subunit